MTSFVRIKIPEGRDGAPPIGQITKVNMWAAYDPGTEVQSSSAECCAWKVLSEVRTVFVQVAHTLMIVVI